MAGTFDFDLELLYRLDATNTFHNLADAIPGIFDNPEVVLLELYQHVDPFGALLVRGVIRILHATDMVMRATNWANIMYLASSWFSLVRHESTTVLAATPNTVQRFNAYLEWSNPADNVFPLDNMAATTIYGCEQGAVWDATAPIFWQYSAGVGVLKLLRGVYTIAFNEEGTGLNDPHFNYTDATEISTLAVYNNSSTVRSSLKVIEVTAASASLVLHNTAVTTVTRASFGIFASPGINEVI